MKKFVAVSLLAISHALVCMLACLAGWYAQSVIVGVSGILTVFFCYKKLSLGGWSLLVVAPFYAVYVPASILLNSYMTYPIWMVGGIVCITTFLLLKMKVGKLKSVFVLFMIILVNVCFVMPNNFAFLYQQKNPEQIFHSEMLKMLDENGRPVSLESLSGKIVVLDVWNRGCASCIRGFPAFEQLAAHYAADSNIVFATLYLHSKYFQDMSPSKPTAKYRFRKFYMINPLDVDALPITGFPTVLVWDTFLTCVYAGELHTEANVFIGNAHTILKRLQKRRPAISFR